MEYARCNASFVIDSEVKTTYFTPVELIDSWNLTNNTLEGVLVKLLDEYLNTQAVLRTEILDLAELNDQLKQTALMHDPSGLINYVDLLITTAKAGSNQGSASGTFIMQLTTASETLLLLNELKMNEKQIGGDVVILVDVLDFVLEEMRRRMALSANDRVAEEKKPCSMYNMLRLEPPQDLMKKAPQPLKTESLTSNGALYEENLKAVVSLAELVLKDGGVAALAATPAS